MEPEIECSDCCAQYTVLWVSRALNDVPTYCPFCGFELVPDEGKHEG
jgi:hypothetical protein